MKVSHPEDIPLLVKSDNGKLVIYNNKINVSIDAKGNIASNDFKQASGKYETDYATGEYVNGKYILTNLEDSDFEKVELKFDSTEMDVKIFKFNQYRNSLDNYMNYKISFDNNKIVTKMYMNPEYSFDYEKQFGLVFAKDRLYLASECTANLDSEGKTTSFAGAISYGSMQMSYSGEYVYTDNKVETLTDIDMYGKMKEEFTLDNGRITKIETYNLSEENEYVLSRTYNYAYTTFGYISSSESDYPSTSSWISDSKSEYTYNDKNYVETSISYSRHQTDTEYYSTGKSSYEYDNLGRKTIHNEYYLSGDEYVLNYSYETEYNNDGLVSKETSSHINTDGTKDYANSYYSIYTYTNGTLSKEEVYYYQSNSEDSAYRGKEYAYSSSEDEGLYTLNYTEKVFGPGSTSGTLEYERTETYKDDNYKYLQHYKIEDNYSGTAKITEITTTYDATNKLCLTGFVYNNTEQGITKTCTYTYDANGKISESHISTVKGSNPAITADYKYNEDGYVIESIEYDDYEYDEYIKTVNTYKNDYIKTSTIYLNDGSDYTIKTIVDTYKDNSEALESTSKYYYSASSITSIETIYYGSSSRDIIKTEIIANYPSGNVMSEVTMVNYTGTNKKQTVTCKNYADSTAKLLTSETTQTYDQTDNDKVISGTKVEYNADGTTVKARYTWNTETSDWEEVTQS